MESPGRVTLDLSRPGRVVRVSFVDPGNGWFVAALGDDLVPWTGPPLSGDDETDLLDYVERHYDEDFAYVSAVRHLAYVVESA